MNESRNSPDQGLDLGLPVFQYLLRGLMSVPAGCLQRNEYFLMRRVARLPLHLHHFVRSKFVVKGHDQLLRGCG